jgi:hypothetical protein
MQRPPREAGGAPRSLPGRCPGPPGSKCVTSEVRDPDSERPDARDSGEGVVVFELGFGLSEPPLGVSVAPPLQVFPVLASLHR